MKIKRLSELAIGDKLRKGVNFWVGTNDERKDALKAAKFDGAEIITRQNKTKGGFNIHFLNPSPK